MVVVCSHPSHHINASSGNIFVRGLVLLTVRILFPSRKILCCFSFSTEYRDKRLLLVGIRLSWISFIHMMWSDKFSGVVSHVGVFPVCTWWVCFLDAAVFCFRAWHSTIPHHMLPSHARRYYARICHADSSDIFPSWKYGVVFVSFELKDTSFIFFISFSWFLFMHIAVAWESHGLWLLSALSPHFNIPDGTVWCANSCPMDDSGISPREILCFFSFFIRTFGTCVSFVSLNFVFTGFFPATWLCKICGFAGSNCPLQI